MDIRLIRLNYDRYFFWGLAILVLGCFLFKLDLYNEAQSNYFQRSGTIIISICLVLGMIDVSKIFSDIWPTDEEMALTKTYQSVHRKSPPGTISNKKDRFKKFHTSFYVIFSVIGTLITGYGDWIVEWAL